MWRRRRAGRETGFLARLRRDARGNTLALMAAMLIPLCGLTGSAIDMARLYAVKARLQQACDAGALAGRKSMMSTGSSTLDKTASDQATAFFNNNFKNGWFSTNTVSFVPSQPSQNHVAGLAKATVPMTIMRMFGQPSKQLVANCDAEYDIADADIVFVLDTTGSMACLTSDSTDTCNKYAATPANVLKDSKGYYVVEKTGSTPDTKSRLDNLRDSVSTFYTTLTSQADPNTVFRFAFMPYSSTVNVGALLKRSYLQAANWTYQSRTQNADAVNGSPANTTLTGLTQPQCNAKVGTTDAAYTANAAKTGQTDPGFTRNTYLSFVSWSSSNGGTCVLNAQSYKAMFTYGPRSLDVSAFANNISVASAGAIDGSSSSWNGCVEERYTAPGVLNPSATSPPLDLDVDTEPTSDGNTQWAPMWPDVEYARVGTATEDWSGFRSTLSRMAYFGSTYYQGEVADEYNELACPRAAQALKTMTKTDIDAYLKPAAGFRAYGTTYHDVGMTWGTRLFAPWLRPATTGTPRRFIIFLTDGTMETDELTYASHGMEKYDNRVRGTTGTDLNTLHNNRFATACTIAKDANHQIKVFTISFATGKTSQLSACASPGLDYVATDTAGLNVAFNAIAQQIAMLRLAK